MTVYTLTVTIPILLSMVGGLYAFGLLVARLYRWMVA